MNEGVVKQPLTVDVYNPQGEVVRKREISPDIFGVQVKPALIHEVVVAMRAAARKVVAHTKTRGEVRGGGKKPWRQKGTGRARHGSIRSPLWKGGGVVFGPRADRNYEKKVNKKVRQKALCMVFSDRVQHGRAVFVDAWNPKEPKTKDAASLLSKLPCSQGKKGALPTIGFITPIRATAMAKSLRNLAGVSVIGANSLNIVELVKPKWLVVPVGSLDHIEKLFSKKKKNTR